jgi:excisionase family DNA binding protein
MNDYLTTRQISEALGISQGCVLTHIYKGHLPSIVFGNSRAVLRNDLEEFKRNYGANGFAVGRPRKLNRLIEVATGQDILTTG